MPYFQSKDPALAEYNGKHIVELGRWLESCDGYSPEAWEVVEVKFDDGTIFTCFPSEVLEVHPYAEQFRCTECSNLALYVTDHRLSCMRHPDNWINRADLN